MGKEHRATRVGGAAVATSVQRATTPGKRTRAEGLAVQHAAGPTGEAAPAGVHAAAAHGTAGPAQSLPHLGTIQRAFGGHDVSGVRAFVGGPAAEASHAMGARAYATGDATAFAEAPDLHTAAHEAAHVVQQRAGVHLKGGVGQAGDAYEANADAVADRVVAGQSAADLLPPVGDAATGHGAVQRDDITNSTVTETNRSGNTYRQNLSVNRTTGTATVSLGIQWIRTGTWGASPDRAEEVYNGFIAWIRSTISHYLNGHFKVMCSPNQSDAGATRPREVLISFRLDDDRAGYPITLVGQGHGTSFMSTTGGTVYQLGLPNETAQIPQTVAHELGHALLGANDEYTDPSDPSRPIFTDHSIMGNYYNAPDQAEFKVRHLEHLLQPIARLYPDHTCRLVRY